MSPRRVQQHRTTRDLRRPRLIYVKLSPAGIDLLCLLEQSVLGDGQRRNGIRHQER